MAGQELTKAQQEKLTDEAFRLERRIVENVQRWNSASWDLAKDLYKFHEIGAWSTLGYETLNEFLAQPSLGMKRTQFFRLTKMWRDLVVVNRVPLTGLKKLDPTKVSEVMPAINRGEVKIEAALADVEVLGQRDLREKYSPNAAQKPDAPLDAEKEPVRVQCDKCGSWYAPDDGGDE